MILLDTQTVLWLDLFPNEIGANSQSCIRRAVENGTIAVATISFWEISLLVSRNRVRLPLPVSNWRQALKDAGLTEFPLTAPIAIQAAHLPDCHKDPADRFIIATALHHNATLVTSDRKILDWSGRLNRQDVRA